MSDKLNMPTRDIYPLKLPWHYNFKKTAKKYVGDYSKGVVLFQK